MKFKQNWDKRDRRRLFFEAGSLSRPQSVLNVGPEVTPRPYLSGNCLDAAVLENWHRQENLFFYKYTILQKQWPGIVFEVIKGQNFCWNCLRAIHTISLPDGVWCRVRRDFAATKMYLWKQIFAQTLVDNYCRSPAGRKIDQPLEGLRCRKKGLWFVDEERGWSNCNVWSSSSHVSTVCGFCSKSKSRNLIVRNDFSLMEDKIRQG